MGKKLLSKYIDYVKDNISDDIVLNIVYNTLLQADDANAERPASSTGKYHPLADLGEGGLVRHSIMVAEVTKILMRCKPYYDNQLNKDIVIASAILHDICKYNTDSEHTNFDHPKKAAALIIKVGKMFTDDIYIDISKRIAKNVAAHMSRWNTNEKYAPGVELLTPTDEEQYLLCYSDLIAANAQLPELMIKFREEGIKAVTGR